jgi:ABC-type transporter MlaC component
MAWSTWRGVLGGSLAAVLLIASAARTWAETVPTTNPAVANSAAKDAATSSRAKPKIAKGSAKREAAQPAKKAAAAKPDAPTKRLAAAKKQLEAAKKIKVAEKKSEPAKKIEVAKKAAPVKPAKPAPPSYTITTVRDGITQTTTRIVPLPPTPAAVAPAAPAETKVAAAPEAKPAQVKPVTRGTQVASAESKSAAIPLSLSERATPARPGPSAAVAATSPAAPADKSSVPAVAAQPTDRKEATSFVEKFLSDAFRIAKSDGTSLQRRARLAELFASHMDVKRIAGYTTADELAGASNEIQQRFRAILVSYLVETYYPQLELASDPSVTVDTASVEPLSNGTAVVWTTFTKDGWGSQSVKWHLINEDGHYRIVDIFSAGASLVQMERDTFLSVMRNGGLNELMAKLDARTKELASAATE